MILRPKTINEVVDKFVINTLPTIIGEPDYEALNEMIQALYANATTLTTTLAGGKHGHISLIIKETLYTTLATVTPWEDSDSIGARPIIATNITVTHTPKGQWDIRQITPFFWKHRNHGQGPRQQIIETIEDNYIPELRNKYTGFMGVKTIYLVQHLMGRYGRMTETDLKENLKRFDEALDTAIPIGKYFEQIDDYIQYVDGGK